MLIGEVRGDHAAHRDAGDVDWAPQADRVEQIGELVVVSREIVAELWSVREAASEVIVADNTKPLRGERVGGRVPDVIRNGRAREQHDRAAAVRAADLILRHSIVQLDEFAWSAGSRGGVDRL